MLSRPDILVLGGGGVLGRAWMTGVLAGVEAASGVDLRGCEYFVGTSAGSVLSALLAAGHSPEPVPQPGAEVATARAPAAVTDRAAAVELARRAGAWAIAAGSPLVPVALGLGAPAGGLLRAALLRAVGGSYDDHHELRREIDGAAATFDGRLRIVAVDRRTGRRVVFGAPGSPRSSVGEAVEASCAIPGRFPPVRIGRREYVDGGVWSPTNLDVAPAGRDTCVLCLSPLAGGTREDSRSAAVRGFVRSAITLESLALRRRGASVVMVAPDQESVAAIGRDRMNREPRARVLAAGYRQGLALAATGDAEVRER